MWIKYTLSILALTLLTTVESSTSTLSKLVDANNDFGMRLYKQVVGVLDDENIFMSPFSISTALAMTYGGARGKTATEMRKVMRFEEYDVTDNSVHNGFHSLLQTISSSNNDNCTLSLANRLFPDKKLNLLAEFVKMAAEKYSATPKSLDFAGAPDASRRYINDWAANATEQKILNLLSARDVTAQTALVLANAIYFKASWKMQFDKSKSTPHPFVISQGLTVNITMMQVMGKFRYYYDAKLNCQFVELPYGGTDIAMILVVPGIQDGLTALEGKLTISKLNDAISKMTETVITVKMPKFNITHRTNLLLILNNMGIHDLFSPGSANLSGLASSSKNLAVSGVVHKAYISVNEEGTEAAAATAVVITESVVRPVEVVADRPFMFLIRESSTTGSTLFMGRLIQPPKDDEEANSTPSSTGPAAPVSAVACLVSLVLLLFVGQAF